MKDNNKDNLMISDMLSEFSGITDMTNEEAATIISNIMIMNIPSRGSGKSMTQLKMNWALSMAVKALTGGIECTPKSATGHDPLFGLTPNEIIKAFELMPINNALHDTIADGFTKDEIMRRVIER